MPIHIVLGKPGSGKSLYATSKVVEELANGTRNIVTNLPLRPDALNEYLQKRFPDRDCRMVQRLRILTDDELKTFWHYRGPDYESKSWIPPIVGADPGVDYYLDEAHIGFNARDWATIGRGALHYLSQHRKLGDRVWPITQAPGNLDKQFRSVAEDFTVIRNEYTAKFGIFKGRGRFVRKTYLSEPSGNAEPFETASFTLDKEGIAACYDTARGIGVHGSKADIGRRAKGIPIMWVIPAGLLVGVACFFIPSWLGKQTRKALGSEKAKPAQVAAPSPLSAFQPGRNPAPGLPAVAAPPAPSVPPLYVRGIVVRGRRFNAFLSDGRTLTEADHEVSEITRSTVVLKSGQRLALKAPPRIVGAGVESTPERAEPAAIADKTGRNPARGERVEATKPGEVATLPPPKQSGFGSAFVAPSLILPTSQSAAAR